MEVVGRRDHQELMNENLLISKPIRMNFINNQRHKGKETRKYRLYNEFTSGGRYDAKVAEGKINFKHSSGSRKMWEYKGCPCCIAMRNSPVYRRHTKCLIELANNKIIFFMQKNKEYAV